MQIYKMKVPGDREYTVEMDNAVMQSIFNPVDIATRIAEYDPDRVFSTSYKADTWRVRYGDLSEQIRFIWDDMINHIKPRDYTIEFHYNAGGGYKVVFYTVPYMTQDNYMYFRLKRWSVVRAEQ